MKDKMMGMRLPQTPNPLEVQPRIKVGCINECQNVGLRS